MARSYNSAAPSARAESGFPLRAHPLPRRRQLLEGTWDATAVLLAAGDAIDATAARLPYVGGYAD